MAKVLEVTTPDGTKTAVHMLNPGEFFPRFGGSRSGLLVGKTASLIVSRKTAMGTVDTELDIHDKNFWRWIAGLIDQRSGAVIVATGDEEKNG